MPLTKLDTTAALTVIDLLKGIAAMRCISEMSSRTAIPSWFRYSLAVWSKKSSSLVQSTSASPIIAVCITMMSFTSRMGAAT